MPEQKKVISISTARKKVMGQIEVDGVMVDVHQLSFGTHQRLAELEGTPEYITGVQAAVRVVCPSLTPEQVSEMSFDEGLQVVLFAAGGVAAVERVFPKNVESPETPTSPG